MERAVVVASANGRLGILRAMEVLRRGGTALDAVEAGVREVEADPQDHTVGYGGLPNLLGVVELDAAIMDGRTLATGAVGAVRGFPHPVSVARRVMEELPHVLLVGEGAERFARETGFVSAELLTEEAREIWLRMLREEGGVEDPTRLPYLEKIRTYVSWAMDPEKVRVAYAGTREPSAGGGRRVVRRQSVRRRRVYGARRDDHKGVHRLQRGALPGAGPPAAGGRPASHGGTGVPRGPVFQYGERGGAGPAGAGRGFLQPAGRHLRLHDRRYG